jgi:ABC-2 type transport system ATP-binding protein
MLSVCNLTKTFPGKRSWFATKQPAFTAVNTISFDIAQGEVVGLLGPNGAGKTTTMHMLLNVLNPTSGSITYFGKDLFKHRSEILSQIAFASAYTELPKALTVRENLIIFGRLYGLYGAELKKRIEQYLTLFGISSIAHKETGVLSAGQKTRVMLAKTFMVHPKMVLLDEPTASLDPDIAHDVRSLIVKQQKELGLTVLLASHNMDEVATICNRVIVLSKGKIVDDNSPEQLAKSVASARVHLVVTSGLETLLKYVSQKNYAYTLQDKMIEIILEEHVIAPFLTELALLTIQYSSISIEKPTLEDYFIAIARLSKEHHHV